MTFGEEPQDILARLLGELGSPQPAAQAVRLLRRYGSVPNVLEASWLGLWSVVGLRMASALKSIDAMTRHRVARSMAERPMLRDRPAVEDFLAGTGVEMVGQMPLVIYVDSQLRVIRTEHARRHPDPGGSLDISSPGLRGMAIGAAAFFLVMAGAQDRSQLLNMATFLTLREFSDECGVPLIAQVLVSDGEMLFVPMISLRPLELA